MAATAKSNAEEYEDIDEAEEEALLKSDDENDAVRAKATLNVLLPPPTISLIDEDSLMNEAAQLQDQEVVEAGISDDDDDDEDDEDDDAMDANDKVLQEFKDVLSDLEQNQYAYDKYVWLCELSHRTDDLVNIRNAYNRFATAYPLTPELWMKYISIEANVALSEIEIRKIEELFRRALTDYYSAHIAIEFARLAMRTPEPDRIWNEILGTYGLHCLKGQEFFKRYRQYLSSHTSMSTEEQQDAYIQSFLRELKYPLQNMEESYIEFKIYCEKNKAQIARKIDWEVIDADYFKAKEHLQKILPFEQQLNSIDVRRYRERGDVYINYIKESDKFLDENVLQTVYERMVADCCLNADCWLTYIDFIEYRDEFGRPEELQDLPLFQQDAVAVNNRALRNCTWSEKLYIKRIHLLEKQGKTREEIQEVLESSLSAGFQTADPAVAIWMEYLTYLRRHTDWENEGECDILRKNFNLAWTILGQQWGVLADCNCEILQFWGRLEYGPLQDPKRGKELWTTVMESADNATRSGLWIEFAQLEMRCDLDATRKLYRKALYSPNLDNPPVITSAWERFERCNGTIKSLTLCTKECTEFLAQFHAQREHFTTSSKHLTDKQQANKRKSTASVETAVPEKKTKIHHETERKHKLSDKNSPKKSKPQQQRQEASAFKEHENQAIDLTKDHLRIFLSNLDYNLTENEIRTGLPELKITHIDLIRSANGRSRGFGYLELESAAEVEKALVLDRRSLNGRPLFITSVLRDKEKRQKFKYSDGLEPKKLFVKGLPNDASKEELAKMFEVYGKIKDLRLVYHKSGKFKNIAYVEYEEEAPASKAIMGVDQMELRGHTISVAISAPPPKPSTTPAVNPGKLLGISAKRNKVFDQKPRMSLIPSVVRKKFNANDAGSVSATSTTIQATNGTAATKTNEDFRKLLQK